MKYTLFLLAFLLSASAFAQSSDKYLEVVINEEVVLKVQSAKAVITVESAESQLSAAFESDETMIDNEIYFEDYGEYDWDNMSASERKKMEEKYAEYERKQEERRIAQEERMQVLSENFKAYTVDDLMKELVAAGFTVEKIANSPSEEYDESDYYENEYGDYGSTVNDTVLQVLLYNEENCTQLETLLNEKPAYSTYKDPIFETIDAPLAANAGKMAERAKKQAASLATSMNKKVGALMSMSTVYPGFSQSLFSIEQQLRKYRSERDDSDENPFDGGRPAYIEVIYRFALLD